MRRIVLILFVLAALALACASGNEANQQKAAQTPAAGGGAPQTPVYLPEINTGGSTPPPAAPHGTAPNTVYLPEVSSGSGGPGSTAAPAASPQVLIEVSASTVKVGETLTVTGRPSGIGLPYYTLIVQDAGAPEPQPVILVTYENQQQAQAGTSQVFELVSAEADMNRVTFVLRAKSPGSAAVNINATGEVQTESGGHTWSGGGSQPVAVTVTE